MYCRSLVHGHAPGVEEGKTRKSSKHTSRAGDMPPQCKLQLLPSHCFEKRRCFVQHLHPSYRIAKIISGICFLIHPDNKLPPFEALQRAFCG